MRYPLKFTRHASHQLYFISQLLNYLRGHCESAYTNLKAGTQLILWEETPDTHQIEQFIKL